MSRRSRRARVKFKPPRLFKRHHAGKTLPPGTLVYDREKRVPEVSIRVMDYAPQACSIHTAKRIEDTFPLRDSPTTTWIDIEGLHDVDLLKKFGGHFGLHPLVMEDILNTHQRPKMEEYDAYLYIVVRMLFTKEGGSLHSEQVSLVIGKHFVATFGEIPGDVFDPVRRRIEQGLGRSRRMGPDYLAYLLMDAIVDNYFGVLEKIADRIEQLEHRIADKPQPEDLSHVHELRRELAYLRRLMWPTRDVAAGVQRTESNIVHDETRPYYRDLHDHLLQVIETLDHFRDAIAAMQDLYVSEIGIRTNEVIRTLTIISTIFVPLTFLAGVYGMNFDFLPELHWKHGYLFFWGTSVVVVISLVVFLRRRGWF